MDTGIEFAQEQPTPLVYVLGPKGLHEYISKGYEELAQGGKCP